jgi:predicted NBD/HSP70 family sugar kinase
VGEKWFGLGRGRRDFAALQFDIGVGGGIMLDGHLWGGRTQYTMQLGHTCVDLHGARCNCGLSGCWETIAGLRWLRQAAVAAGLPGGRSTSPSRLRRRVEGGDAVAAAVLDRYSDHLAIGIANLVQMLSLDLFILHGAVVHAGPSFLAELQRKVIARTMPELATGVELVYSQLDQDSILLGAAAVVLTRHLGALL